MLKDRTKNLRNVKVLEIPRCPPDCQAYHRVSEVAAILGRARTFVYESMSAYDAGKTGLRYSISREGGSRVIKHEWIDDYRAAVEGSSRGREATGARGRAARR
jgi:hypothetical protein